MAYSDSEMRGATLYAKLIAALVEVPRTYDELADYTGLSYHTVMRYVKALHDLKHVYIDHWDEDRRGARTKPAWHFTITPRKDARRSPLTRKQVVQRYKDSKTLKVSSVFPDLPVSYPLPTVMEPPERMGAGDGATPS